VHEASIVASMLSLAASRVPDGAALRRVHVRVGALTGVSPDSMRFYFEALRDVDADLDVVVEPLRATCGACARDATLSGPAWTCPACGAPALEYHNGLELDLVAIEVDGA
jgi:hydrogenase nickel incorporation protein HypA/HybF